MWIRVEHQELESTHMKDLLLSFAGGFMSRGLRRSNMESSLLLKLELEASAS